MRGTRLPDTRPSPAPQRRGMSTLARLVLACRAALLPLFVICRLLFQGLKRNPAAVPIHSRAP